MIEIDTYEELQLLGTGETVDGVTYAADGQYTIAQNIELPSSTAWTLPENFTGRIAPEEPSEDRTVYDAESDTIYIYHTLQLAVLAQPNAGEEPVMNNDADPALFGVGQMIWPDGEEQPYLTYGAEHRYVLSTQFTTDLPEEMPGVSTMAVSTGTYDGRDFPGQVIKKIDDVEYILIGNEEQLRAIGRRDGAGDYKEVYTAVYNIWGDTLRYSGDADLLPQQNGTDTAYNFDDRPTATGYGVNQETGEIYGALDPLTFKTGKYYSPNENYIIFRNIELTENWDPMMFSGTMIGANMTGQQQGTLGMAVQTAVENNTYSSLAKPVISNIQINQTEALDISKQMGIGFFATISGLSGISGSGDSQVIGSTDQALVANLCLDNVVVQNNTNKTKYDPSLVGSLVGIVESILGGLLGGVGNILGWLLGLGGKVDLDGIVTDLLETRQKDETAFATGAFAGRITGSAYVTDCEVHNVTVSNISSMTGGFVGYTTGETSYLTKGLGDSLKLIQSLLNIIPGLGLGDLITIVNNVANLGNLIPVGYTAPQINNCKVMNLTGTLGHSANGVSTQAETEVKPSIDGLVGGFIGLQIGTRIMNCAVTAEGEKTDYTIQAEQYGGGFVGLARDAEIKGLLTDVGIELVRAGQPQSLLLNCSINTGSTTVKGTSYLGGFAGALANSYAINDTVQANLTVQGSKTGTDIGGFAGTATVGWISNLGAASATDSSLLNGVTELLLDLLEKEPEKASQLLSLVGVQPSAIMGCQINPEENSGTVTVSGGSYVGGIVGRGDGVYLTESSEPYLEQLPLWKWHTDDNAPPAVTAQGNVLNGLTKVSASKDYAGGVAGYLGGASVGGLLNSTVGLGEFLGFTVDGITLDGAYTVDATGDYAGGAFGMAMAGDASNITINGITSVSARNNAGGFVGLGGPGSLATVGEGGLTLNLLGLDNRINISNILSVIPGVQMTLTDCTVTGGGTGFAVTANGATGSDLADYAAGGFIGRGNSTDMTNCHVSNLLVVTAPTETVGTQGESGFAGGFVGISRNDDLADVLHTNDEETSIGKLISVEQLLGAAPVLTPEFKNCTVQFANLAQNTPANVSADVAGGFAADFQSGTVDNSTREGDFYAVYNVTQVTGRTYAGGFAGKLYSGALANAGGGVSILDGLAGLDLSELLTVVNAYVPMVYDAGVKASDVGLAVSATDIKGESGDLNAGSAGGFAGYASGAQVSTSDVYFLRHTRVTDPAGNTDTDAQALNTDGDSYYTDAFVCAVTGGRYAGGYIGKIDIGSAASVGGGLEILDSISLSSVLEALNVVVTTIEHSDVYGAPGGYAVRAAAKDGNDLIGHAGGFAGTITGGHIQDSHAHNFSHIIGRESAGGYVGEMKPGDVAKLLPQGDVLKQLLNVDNVLSGLQVFVPTIRNSSTDSVPCGGVVWAQAESTGAVTAGSGQTPGVQRGMAGGYVGHNEGGQIRGLDTSSWQTILSQEDENTGERKLTSVYQATYTGPTSLCKAVRIRTVFGSEYAGGYTGFMESADMADAGTVSLLGDLITVNNILSALKAVYPMQENTAVYGPLADLDMDTWNKWVDAVGVNGGYGFELAQAGKVDSQEKLNAKLANYIYGYDVVAGRSAQGVNLPNAGGDAGGYVGLMRSGVLTNCMAYDVKSVQARGAAGGFAGRAEAGGAASLGGANILGLGLDLGKLVNVAELFVPVINNSSVQGYRSGMTVTATGTPSPGDDVGYAGGYVGAAYGAQIQKTDVTVDAPGAQINPAIDLPTEADKAKWAVYPDKADDGYANPDAATYPTPAASCDVRNLRRVAGRSAVGGYVGLASAGSLASVNTNAGSGLLQGILNKVIRSASDLLKLLPATVTTIYKGSVSPADPDWGFVVDGAYGGDQYADYAGGFAGELQAASLGYDANSLIDKEAPGELTVTGLRQVDGGLYAGGFVGLADVNAVAEVGGNTSGGEQTTILDSLLDGLLGLGNIDAADFIRTYIYHASVDGVDEGYRVQAHTNPQNHEGTLSETRWPGCAGGFAGAVLNGTVGSSKAANVATVKATNYTGGFVGHMGKSGVVDVDNVDLLSKLVGLDAGVIDLLGSQMLDCSVSGYANGLEVIATGGQQPSKQPIAGGFAGYADLGRIGNSLPNLSGGTDDTPGGTVTELKTVVSNEVAGGFVGQTDMAYLISLEANSPLVNLVLRIVNALLKALYLDKVENIDLTDINLGFLEVEILSDGNALRVELLGLPITVALSKASDEEGVTDTAIITIGDSEIRLPCTENGITQDQLANVEINLIKANRTEVYNSTVTGIPDGYDVFAGGASDTANGGETLQEKGSAGGFVGYNHEGKIQNCQMVLCDVVRGTAKYVGPFTGYNDLTSVYAMNTIASIEGEGNRYSIYRASDPSLTTIQTSDGDKTVGSDAVEDETTGHNRYDIDHITDFAGIINTDKGMKVYDMFVALDGAKLTGEGESAVPRDLAAYQESGAKAVLMLDTPNDPNPDTMVPEPGEGADPCLWKVDLTVNKVWDDWFNLGEGREKVTLTVYQQAFTLQDEKKVDKDVTTYPSTEEGKVWAPKLDESGTIVAPVKFETLDLTEENQESDWSAVWSKDLENVPVFEFKDKPAEGGNGTWDEGEEITAYYVYTVVEENVPAGYTVSYDFYNPIDAGDYELTVTNKLNIPLPDTGAGGDAMFVAVGVGILLLGLTLTKRRRPRKGER
ncbi:LPXTG cell wall anchor domain-containing protein [uncultured Subdoligranulum sp.]|uniref:LPXTG cell wall anchor domain-containing protein n=1 Tax=uncultured Subdoligranulum sp. TaxID=512298 RepID=UPI0025CE6309|nr:LPXTG cell wall anchor domain-containing protein [uncultured Subdoligranulum sp.]